MSDLLALAPIEAAGCSARRPDGPVVIVDPYSSGAQLAPAFARRGVPCIAVVTAPNPPEVYASSYRPGDFTDIVVDETRGRGLDALASWVRSFEPRCVLAGCESGVELAEQLAPMVTPEVANVAHLAAARRHKGAMAQAVSAAGLPAISQLTTSEPDEVAAWIERHHLGGHDLVLKPPKSASTDGVTRVPGGRGWREKFAALVGTTNRLGLVNDTIVVQEYVTGVEYVVDTFSFAGTHTVTDVCRYTKVTDGEHMAVYDTMEWLTPDEAGVPEVVGYAREVLDAVGVRFGAAHVEIMKTTDGPRLIEVGARAHGGGQPRFCLHATGDSQVERTVRAFTGAPWLPLGYELNRSTLVVFHLTLRSGRVGDMAGLQKIAELDTYFESVHKFTAGGRFAATTDLFGSLDLGFVVLSDADRDRTWRDYERIRAIERDLFVPDESELTQVGAP